MLDPELLAEEDSSKKKGERTRALVRTDGNTILSVLQHLQKEMKGITVILFKVVMLLPPYCQAGKSAHPFHLLHVLLPYRLILQ